MSGHVDGVWTSGKCKFKVSLTLYNVDILCIFTRLNRFEFWIMLHLEFGTYRRNVFFLKCVLHITYFHR